MHITKYILVKLGLENVFQSQINLNDNDVILICKIPRSIFLLQAFSLGCLVGFSIKTCYALNTLDFLPGEWILDSYTDETMCVSKQLCNQKLSWLSSGVINRSAATVLYCLPVWEFYTHTHTHTLTHRILYGASVHLINSKIHITLYDKAHGCWRGLCGAFKCTFESQSILK